MHKWRAHSAYAYAGRANPSSHEMIPEEEGSTASTSTPAPSSLASSDHAPASPVSTLPTSLSTSTNEACYAHHPIGSSLQGDLEADSETESQSDGAALGEFATQLCSQSHLDDIIKDAKSLSRLTSFLNATRPTTTPLLRYFITLRRAVDLIAQANNLTGLLDPIANYAFTSSRPLETSNSSLEGKAADAFKSLEHCLSAYVAFTFHEINLKLQRRVIGALAVGIEQPSEVLVEMFSLSDPQQHGNPIVMASKAFSQATQYSTIIGGNCRILQGPMTNLLAVDRISEALVQQDSHSEVILNYRSDGDPFLNLLTVMPLRDQKGRLRYYLGAQIDVSGVLGSAGTAYGAREVATRPSNRLLSAEYQQRPLRETESFCSDRTCDLGETQDWRRGSEDRMGPVSRQPRGPRALPLHAPSIHQLGVCSNAILDSMPVAYDARAPGVFNRYLLFRPTHPFRILFTSPALQIPQMIQSPFLSHIGGNDKVRSDFWRALNQGRRVTAKVSWLSRPDLERQGPGECSWAHCTPLLRGDGNVGVWMVVLMDGPAEDGEGAH